MVYSAVAKAFFFCFHLDSIFLLCFLSGMELRADLDSTGIIWE